METEERPAASVDSAGNAGSRERILTAATRLFYEQGIQATGVEELAASAGVSKRTLYKLFGSKDQLVAAYLEKMHRDLVSHERPLWRLDLTPRERLIALFDQPAADRPYRGCPFHNAAVELSGPAHPAHPVIRAHKQAALRRIVDTAREAGADDPETLGQRIFVLYEGATALSTSIGGTQSFDYARPVATTLIEQAVGVSLPGRTGQA
jgi:AcrR family transcriptional regulator